VVFSYFHYFFSVFSSLCVCVCVWQITLAACMLFYGFISYHIVSKLRLLMMEK